MFDELRTQLWRIKRIWHYESDPSWTHVPHLCAIARHIKPGSICEFGVGNYSTPVIHNLFTGNIYSYDNSREWLEKFEWQYSSRRHRFFLLNDWFSVQFPPDIALAFIDNAPGHTRQFLLDKLDGVAKAIVLHDAEGFTAPKNYSFITLLGDKPPKTLICSNENLLG